jgi:ABC-2 type transport system ATP-binding protein
VVLHIGLAGNSEGAARLLEDHPAVASVTAANGKLEVTLGDGVEDYSELPTLLVQAGYRLNLFREEELNLETAFMALTKGITS